MLNQDAKPKLIFFQNKYDETLPEFLLVHKQEHVACLSFFFDVTVINHDCDYQKICDEYQPDLVLFESGVNLFTCRRPKITNTRVNPRIPKLGFLNADAWCETRSGSISEMDQWGIQTIFSISATAPEHLPALAGRLFIWPNFVDPATYHDYGEHKRIPVFLSGATAAQYPWRRQIHKLIANRYPTLRCPHRGYHSRSSAGQVLYGEAYARTINASQVAAVCGTVAKEVVRKHFEIPACNACLVTERSHLLEEAGFVDMTNCVFADSSDVLDKLHTLFANPDRLIEITAAGHDLVHSRHLIQHRSQILQWFHLQSDLGANEKIDQPNPFAPLAKVGRLTTSSDSATIEVGMHLQLLREGDRMLAMGRTDAAAEKYRRCLSYMQRLPEARFKIALCKLLDGHAAESNASIFELVQYSIDEYGAIDPDPIEWAYYITSLIAMGRLNAAEDCAAEFPWLRHIELDRVRNVIRILCDRSDARNHSAVCPSEERQSIHQIASTSDAEWNEYFCSVMQACGQWALAERLKNVDRESPDLQPEILSNSDARPEVTSLSRPSRTGMLGRELVKYRIFRKARNVQARAIKVLMRAASRFVTTPPQGDSRAFLIATIRDIARDQDLRSALILGGGSIATIVGAVRDGTVGSDHDPLICCVTDSSVSPALRRAEMLDRREMWYEMRQASGQTSFSAELEETLRRIRFENGIDRFDMVVAAWSSREHSLGPDHSLRRELLSARTIVLHELKEEASEICAQLYEMPEYVELAHDPSGNSYAVLQRVVSKQEDYQGLADYSSSFD
jgi:hypothetical protein